jgi:nucleotide-binding universal stress UspA family protein
MVSGSIIGAIDGSERTADVLRVAVPLSSRLKTRLVLLHVAQMPTIPGASAVPDVYEELREAVLIEGHDLLERAAEEYGVPPGTELAVEVGDPADRIAAVAKHQETNLIVVASGGKGPTKSAFVGSVSASLGAAAPCPVIVVPPGAVADGRSSSPPLSLFAVDGEAGLNPESDED